MRPPTWAKLESRLAAGMRPLWRRVGTEWRGPCPDPRRAGCRRLGPAGRAGPGPARLPALRRPRAARRRRAPAASCRAHRAGDQTGQADLAPTVGHRETPDAGSFAPSRKRPEAVDLPRQCPGAGSAGRTTFPTRRPVQRLAIIEYARTHDIRIDDFIEATASGQASEKRRRR